VGMAQQTGSRSRSARGEPQGAGVHHLLRVPRPRHRVSCGGPVVAGGIRGERFRRPGGPGSQRSSGPRHRILADPAENDVAATDSTAIA
jgi:hypothetical protein